MALISHFFTDLGKVANSQPSQNAFGPIGSTDQEKEKKFNLTNVFSKKSGISDQPPAYAVTGGVLFIVPQNGNPDLVNIFLKPTTQVEIGVKIKYYVYRSINRANFFQASGSSFDLLPKNDANILPFLNEIWKEFQEFNDIPDQNVTSVNFQAEKIGFSPDQIEHTYKSFFKSIPDPNPTNPNQANLMYNLPKVEIGYHIGNFDDSFGFEVVVDEGDFIQEHSDTGFEFNDDFFRAKQCILNLNLDAANKNPSNIYGNLPTTVSEKIFRESVYLFLDPAAFYGMHATTSIKGKVKVGTSAYATATQIATNILPKFINKNKTYLYIKSSRGRSYGFYDSTKNIKYENVNSFSAFTASTQPISFEEKKWPLLVDSSFDKGTLILSLENIENKQNAIFVHNFSSNSPNNFSNENWLGTNAETTRIGVIGLPTIGGTVNANFIVCTYQDISNFNEIFGRVNLDAIFEKADFETASNDVSFVDHLRPVLIKDEDDLGLYHTKVALDGAYVSNTTPTGSSTNDDLRTYILFPQKSTRQRKGVILDAAVKAGYYTKGENKSNDYIRQIYGGGEIWRGLIVDIISGNTVNIKSLLYRRKDNDDEMPIYQLGISHNEYIELENNAKTIDADATNFFFDLEEDTTSTSTAFIRYNLRLAFDKKDGTKDFTTLVKLLYTIDGYFFFTQGYSEKFDHYKEFGNIAVDFLPYNLSTYINGYECGFDYVGFEGRENYNKIIGKYYKKSTGDLENVDSDNGIAYEFKKKRLHFFRLLYREYNSKPTSWRNSSSDFPFHTDSYLTLYPDQEVSVKLKFSKLNPPPDKLYLRYDSKFVSIDNSAPSTTSKFQNFEIPKVNYENTPSNDYTIVIKSLLPNKKHSEIEVFSVVNNSIFPAGKLLILKNDDRYILKTILVNVKTQVENTIKEGLTSTSYQQTKNIINNFLNQAYLKITEDHTKIFTLDLSSNNNFKVVSGSVGSSLFSYTNNAGVVVYTVKTDNSIFSDLVSILQIQLNNNNVDIDVNDYFILFFFNEEGGSNGNTAGIADSIGGLRGARIYSKGLLKNTIVHEVLHSIALYHSFDNSSKYTFQITYLTGGGIIDMSSSYPTDNLMDYFNPQPSEDYRRKFIWKWQIDRILDIDYGSTKLIKEP